MGLFGSGRDDSDDGLRRRVAELERRVAALERAASAAGHPVSLPPTRRPDEMVASQIVRQLALQGNKIAAVKLLRDETGLRLKEAKDIVDRLA
ncbi:MULTISPECIES: ribosomal protein L7/L12 [unclassified Mycolicibacterium]|uniref:ribosomal protein L7/L12 n=1 Tax=unclassified Mycolicibacterium TaxID=2636767 RepID=UPI0012DD3DF0|nr:MULTISPECIES: ribosomal protein L7/L12 [unclassified Mycolicibacterium]MUL84904.1 ribosomal protein L7/L12 [Mycolicibacterium sp. CBMA 329]MUL90871.1 ribosomal protein L7/L12 [Mycolicibacterium sp. CBMA 331]MUM01819.1 ribosomal protein L7/L12 [Mycolicibacterium sp. CBMA 334]MUM29261.1 ribosomal protein L7/L12 [Mycolicibacterium sp. CBMA 295]MUM40630.1 ribosomal protein L7/L12 [Mycolicibacterium sp. CBMA 247]